MLFRGLNPKKQVCKNGFIFRFAINIYMYVVGT